MEKRNETVRKSRHFLEDKTLEKEKDGFIETLEM